jgi:hypothetical protein
LDGTKSGCVSQSCGLQGLRLRPGKAGSAAPACEFGRGAARRSLTLKSAADALLPQDLTRRAKFL